MTWSGAWTASLQVISCTAESRGIKRMFDEGQIFSVILTICMFGTPFLCQKKALIPSFFFGNTRGPL